MSRRTALGTHRNNNSASVTPSSKYIGFWPGTMYINPAGTLIAPSITLAVAGISGNAIGDTSSPSAGNQAWIAAGKRVKIHNNGTMPTGLAAATLYYVGRPSATTITFHTTKADALANTNLVSMSGGSSTIVVFQCAIPDHSGNARDLTIGTGINETNWFTTPPFLSGTSSGSNDTMAARLDLSGVSSLLAWPTCSFLISARVLGVSAYTAGRSFMGCGVAASTDGPKLNVGASGTEDKIVVQLMHGGSGASTLTLGTTAASVMDSTEHTLALGIDGPAKRGYVWVDGAPDLTVWDVDLSAVASITWPAAFGFGGASATNAQASRWRGIHWLATQGSLPSNKSAIAALLANKPYHRLSTREW